MRFVFDCPCCKAQLEADASACGRQSHCPQCGQPVAVPEARLDCGSILGGFRLERRLGKGGMGEVFLATQLSVKRNVAVKVLPPGFAANPEAVQRFLQEGQLAARLDHAGIVTVFEAGEDCGTFYLAMAYVDGESLDRRLGREGRLPEAEALAIARTLADALAYAWEVFRLLHRDLKPGNIMVDRRGRVFLMDLGLAKSLGEETGLTLSGAVLGTPQYMSPEQALGRADLGVATDVYSLGATLYHLVTGAPPFAGDTALQVLHEHLNTPLPPPRSRNPALSEGCCRLLGRLLAKDPGDRYGDWQAVISDIDRVQAGGVPAEVSRQEPGEAGSRLPAAPGAPAAPAAMSRIAMARQAQEALARQHQAQARAAAVPAADAGQPALPRRAWLPIAVGATAVVVALLLWATLGRSRGRTAGPGDLARPTDLRTPTDPARRAGQAEATPGPGARPPISPEAVAGGRPADPGTPAATPAPQPAKPPPETVDSGTGPKPGLPKAPPAVPGSPPALAEASLPGPSAPPAAPAPPAPPPPSLAAGTGATALAPLAKLLVSGLLADALQSWRDQGDRLAGDLTADQRETLATQIEALAGMDRQVLASFQPEIGKRIEIQLVREKVTGEVREVAGDTLRLNQILGQGQGQLGLTLRASDLAVAERLRRLGTADTAELNLQRGLLALEAGRPDSAHRLFLKAGGPLAEALVASLDAQQARATEAAAEQALVELLRQISTSAAVEAPAGTTAAIRKRCEGNLKRVQGARRALAAFEKEWGQSETGKTWVPVVREAVAACSPWPGERWTVPGLGLELVPVPAGSFQMGSDRGKVDSRPVHTVRITRDFWLGRTEVTQRQYEALAGANPSEFRGPDLPVEGVNWEDAAGYCRRLTKREQAAGRLPDGLEYRLPTEAEWEYAARGGPLSQGHAYAGSGDLEVVAWSAQNSANTTHPVGQKMANGLGLHDMSGNVQEWCLDWGDPEYYSRSPEADPVNTKPGSAKVVRGGAWNCATWVVELACRGGAVPAFGVKTIGFRVCLAPQLDGQ
jgi:formylglycine-generating enzyme required for sulfatase activity